MPEPTTRLVLIYHGAKEGRGAWFDPGQGAALAKVAAQPNYVLIEAETALLDELDPDMPKGSLGADGKPAPLPVMLRSSHDALLKMAEGKKAVTTTGQHKPVVPAPWSDLRVGSIVLASDSKDEGWFECVVSAVESSGEVLHLRWRDFPDLEHFRKSVTRVGLLPPSGLR